MKTKRIIGAIASFAMIFSSLGVLSASAENQEQFLAGDYDYITVTEPTKYSENNVTLSDNIYTLKITKPCTVTADFVTYLRDRLPVNVKVKDASSLDYEICLGTDKTWVSKTNPYDVISFDIEDSESLSYTVTMDDINSAGGEFTLYCGARVRESIQNTGRCNTSSLNNVDWDLVSIDYFDQKYHFTLTAKLTDDEERSQTLTGSFEHAEESKVYSVDIQWGSMNFTYEEPSKGVWDTKNHEYINPVVGGWSCDEDANRITLTNRSNAAIDAAVAFDPAEEYSELVGEFSSSVTVSDGELDYRLETAEAYTVGDVQYPAGARSQDIYFSIKSGELPENAVNAKLGRITITLEEAEYQA